MGSELQNSTRIWFKDTSPFPQIVEKMFNFDANSWDANSVLHLNPIQNSKSTGAKQVKWKKKNQNTCCYMVRQGYQMLAKEQCNPIFFNLIVKNPIVKHLRKY